MKSVICLMLVVIGLGVGANGSQKMELALSICFFVGAINLIAPALNALQLLNGSIFSKKSLSAKRSHR